MTQKEFERKKSEANKKLLSYCSDKIQNICISLLNNKKAQLEIKKRKTICLGQEQEHAFDKGRLVVFELSLWGRPVASYYAKGTLRKIKNVLSLRLNATNVYQLSKWNNNKKVHIIV